MKTAWKTDLLSTDRLIHYDTSNQQLLRRRKLCYFDRKLRHKEGCVGHGLDPQRFVRQGD